VLWERSAWFVVVDRDGKSHPFLIYLTEVEGTRRFMARAGRKIYGPYKVQHYHPVRRTNKQSRRDLERAKAARRQRRKKRVVV
jgi:hypothetical protein